MTKPIYTEKHAGATINIYYDNSPETPRVNDGWITEFATKDHRYDFDTSGINFDRFESANEILNYLRKEKGAHIILPLYKYEHRDIVLKTGPFGNKWDSGQIGYIYVTKKKLKEVGIDKWSGAKIIEDMKSELETYTDYLNGNVYGYQVIGRDGEEESCWGFIGDYDESYGALGEARRIAEYADEQWHKKQVAKGFYGRNNPFRK